MDDASILAVPGRTVARQVAWLAIPVLVEQTLLYLVGLSDTILTGRYLSEDYLAAVTVASYLLWFLGSLMSVVTVGATAVVARRIGSRHWDEARRICQQTIFMALALGFVVLLTGWWIAPTLVRWMNLEGRSAEAAIGYLRVVLFVTPLLACTTVGIACLRGAGDTRTGMWVMILVNTINIVLSWCLVQGFGPFPERGFSGIAEGTACAEGIGGAVVLLVLTRGRAGMAISWRTYRPFIPDILRILRVSVPAAGESLTNIFCQLWFLSLINRLGVVATAAHGVAIRCEAIAFLTVTAFSVAASTLTGQYLGAGRPDVAARAARAAWALGVLSLSGLGFLIYALAEPMFSLFLNGRQAAVAELGVPVLRLVAFALPGFATINVLSGALRGAGDTRWPWVFTLAGYLLFRLPLTYFLAMPQELGGLDWGLYGAWVAMFVDIHARGVLVAGRFLQGGWRLARV